MKPIGFPSLSVLTIALSVFASALVLLGTPGQAVGKSIIRDAEIERTIRSYAWPLFRAAGLTPDAVRILIINDKSLNAYVSGGQRMHLHTGLLLRAETASQIKGVIAHETGHISGGHLVRLTDKFNESSSQYLLSSILGAAVGVATGRGDVGTAVALGGQEMARRNFFSFSRVQESSADQAGLSYLEATGQSARGLLEFFEILGDQEVLLARQQDAYVRTHPLTRDRMDSVRSFLSRSPYAETPPTSEEEESFRRLKAKLSAYLEAPVLTMRRYPAKDMSISAQYARAIAWHKRGLLDKSLPIVDNLLTLEPNNPFFHELKGQILFEGGSPANAIAPYRKAVELAPEEALLRVSLGQALIETGDPTLLPEAQKHLGAATQLSRASAFTWGLLGIAYGRDGREGMASYALAEQAMLQGDRSKALGLAKRAETQLPEGSGISLRVKDIINAMERSADGG